MCTVPASVIHSFRSTLRKGLGITRRQRGPCVQIKTTPDALVIRAKTSEVAIEYSHSGKFSVAEFAFPFSLLQDCTADSHAELTFRAEGGKVQLRWSEFRIPKRAEATAETFGEFPETPDKWIENPPELMEALRDASESAEREPARFTLSHLRMRGSDGQVVGTDGRQLFAQSGFSFPWDNAKLIPASRLFSCSSLQTISSMSVGEWNERVALRTGPWTLWFKVNRTGRFPEIDSLLEKANSATTRMKLFESDAKYLLKSIRHLPGADDFNAPITVDLNGAVVLRSASSEQKMPTEMILTQSGKEGADIRFAVNRQYLFRAVQLGFRTFEIRDAESPVVAQDGRRTMVWANLGKVSVLPPVEGSIRVESPMLRESLGHSRSRCGKSRRLNRCQVSTSRRGQEGVKLKTIIDTLRSIERQASDQAAKMELYLNSLSRGDESDDPASPSSCEARTYEEAEPESVC